MIYNNLNKSAKFCEATLSNSAVVDSHMINSTSYIVLVTKLKTNLNEKLTDKLIKLEGCVSAWTLSSVSSSSIDDSYSKFKLIGNTLYQVWCANKLEGKCSVFLINLNNGQS